MKLMMLRALRRRRMRPKIGRAILFSIPQLCTFSNALLGFFSIITVLEGHYVIAAYCIVLAACMDALDGRLARMFKATSELGMELDSLCDAVSFCLAPTILLYSWKLDAVGNVGMTALMAYVCAGLYRLAKFNVTAVEQSRYFIGVPTPVAALVIAGLVVGESVLRASFLAFLVHEITIVTLVIALALLMVSKVRIPTFKHSESTDEPS